jgi:hypothetical protein
MLRAGSFDGLRARRRTSLGQFITQLVEEATRKNT